MIRKKNNPKNFNTTTTNNVRMIPHLGFHGYEVFHTTKHFVGFIEGLVRVMNEVEY